MTRVVAGRLGGRRLATPPGDSTRPTSDRVREALYSGVEALLDLRGAHVLDLYCGSGALGLEAASRGAAHVLLVDVARRAVQTARRNVAELGLEGAAVVVTERVERLLAHRPEQVRGALAPYDLVLLDPPYDTGEDQLASDLDLLLASGWLADDPLLVVERGARSPEPTWPAGLRPVRSRRYGETVVHLAERAYGADDILPT
ncbi:16S rRNA (guanine(966)-N(2))-methyltransferase RsmD [Ornithinicoccus halotolerans]|uniref:16S rRNA (guanine(966)-N(2))-methyltransferase RsmD n=1 Tax=Ornithinicoccus halotolerans TaxID=1748220 RepID=UPI00129529BA|nr:16S rRNA (guanine(966)-N(2))-methyltransferase RsmD [Ornithinicoccus halotolerans]